MNEFENSETNVQVGSGTAPGSVTVVRKPHLVWNNVIRPVLLMLLIMLLGEILGMLLDELMHSVIIFIAPQAENSDLFTTASLYFSTVGTWLVGLLIIGESRKDSHLLKTLWTSFAGNNIPNFLGGLLSGFLMNALCILIAYMNGDIFLYFDSAKPFGALILFVCVFIQSSSEELICRGYLYNKFIATGRAGFAIIGNACIFAALHLMNPGLTALSLLNIFLSGVYFSIAMYKGRSFWFAAAAHTAWNFTQNILFGLPNSGIVVPFSIFKLDASTAVDSFAYNVDFGIEGTAVAAVVQIIGCVLAWFIPDFVFFRKMKKE